MNNFNYQLLNQIVKLLTHAGTTEQPEVQDEYSVVCDEALCQLRKAGDEAVRDFFAKSQRNGKVLRPKCSNIPGLYWDQMNCSDSGKLIMILHLVALFFMR